MECIRGKMRYDLSGAELEKIAGQYDRAWIDVGTGDGRFVETIALTTPSCFVIGVDSCRENLRTRSRRAPDNALFVVASALEMPSDLTGMADHLTINFPWGSLLRGLLQTESTVWQGVRLITRSDARLTILGNAEALGEEGLDLEAGASRLQGALRSNDFEPDVVDCLDRHDLAGLSTTWSKRLAFGRDPRAVGISATRMDRSRIAVVPGIDFAAEQRLLGELRSARGPPPGATRNGKGE